MELSERAIMALEHWAKKYEWQEGKGNYSLLDLQKLELEREALEHKVQLNKDALEKKIDKLGNIRDPHPAGMFFFDDKDNQSVSSRALHSLRRWAGLSNRYYANPYITEPKVIRSLYSERLTVREALRLRNFGNKALEWLQQRLVKYGFDPLPKQ